MCVQGLCSYYGILPGFLLRLYRNNSILSRVESIRGWGLLFKPQQRKVAKIHPVMPLNKELKRILPNVKEDPETGTVVPVDFEIPKTASLLVKKSI